MRRSIPWRLAAASAAVAVGLTVAVTTVTAEASPTATVDPNAAVGGTVPGVTSPAAGAATEAAGAHFAEIQRQLTAAPDASSTLHAVWGTMVPTTSAFIGAMATQSVDANLKVAANEFVYAPTLMPGTDSCIELTTIYSAGAAQLGAWDWCATAPSFVKVRTVDAAFLATYTATVHGRSAYTEKTVVTDEATNTWTTYLYNHATGNWDVFDSVSGPAALSNTTAGWDLFEIYTNTDPNSGNGYYCADSRGVSWESSGMQWSFTSGVWQKPDTSNSSLASPPTPASFRCPTLTFSIVSANDDFTVTNSAAPTGPITSGVAGKCVDVYQANPANGTHVDIFTCNGHPSQAWTVPGDGTLRALGKCLDVTSSGTADRVKVRLWGCNGTGAQQWKYNASTHALVNPVSGKCLDDPAGSATNNTQLEIFACNGNAGQRWTLPS
jgi:hypothetical protein